MKKETKTTKTVTTQKPIAGSPPGLTQADIQTCLDHAQAIANVLAPYAVTLTTAQRRAQTKYRKEGDSVIPTLARLAKTSGLESTALDVTIMQQQAELGSMLLPLLTTVKTLSDRVSDTVLTAHGAAWHTATTLHGALLRVARTNPALRRDMALVAGAFSRRKKGTADTAAPPTATVNAETPATQVTTEPTAPEAPATVATQAAPIKGA